MELASKGDEWLTSLGLDVRRVDHRQAATGKPLASYIMQNIERIIRGFLGILVVRNKSAAEVRREDFGWLEVSPSEA
jgi:hypothetical protein